MPVIIIIIIIERRDFGGIMSNDCKDILQTQNKTVRVRRSKVSEQSIYHGVSARELVPLVAIEPWMVKPN